MGTENIYPTCFIPYIFFINTHILFLILFQSEIDENNIFNVFFHELM